MIFIPEKGFFGRPSKTVRPKIRNNVFWLPKKNGASKFQGVRLVYLASKKPHDPSSSHPKNNVFLGPRAVALAQNRRVENKKHLNAVVLVRYPREASFRNFWSSNLDFGTQTSLFNFELRDDRWRPQPSFSTQSEMEQDIARRRNRRVSKLCLNSVETRWGVLPIDPLAGRTNFKLRNQLKAKANLLCQSEKSKTRF